MRRLISLLSAGLCCGASAAHAEGYISAGVGSDTELSGSLGERFDAAGLPTGRLGVGFRMGSFALEAVGIGSEMGAAGGFTAAGVADQSVLSLGVDAKLFMDLFAGLEVYGRVGVHRTWLSADETFEDPDYEGRGAALGAGLQYRFDLAPALPAALWVDFDHRALTLESDERSSLSGESEVLTFGASIAL